MQETSIIGGKWILSIEKEEEFSQNTIWALDQKRKQGLRNYNGHFIFVVLLFPLRNVK